jgi:hypothetical protein
MTEILTKFLSILPSSPSLVLLDQPSVPHANATPSFCNYSINIGNEENMSKATWSGLVRSSSNLQLDGNRPLVDRSETLSHSLAESCYSTFDNFIFFGSCLHTVEHYTWPKIIGDFEPINTALLVLNFVWHHTKWQPIIHM